MRVPARSRGRVALQGLDRGNLAGGVPIPAPTGGWNADSPLAAMKEDSAIILDNFFPSSEGVELRRGFWRHTVIASIAAVETLMPYQAALGAADRLFAACGDKIFDVTSRNVTPTAVQVGLSNARWQHVNFANDGGQFLWLCNGADAPRTYNGAAWAIATITGITPTDIIHVTAHKKRLWFVLKNSLNAAYLPVNSIQGAASIFPLGALFTKGGSLVAAGSWSTDAGDGGLDDLIVFVTSRGQVAIYQGTDPSDASDFQFVGVWDFSPPIGRRCILRVANDLAVITQEGIIPISSAMSTDRAALASVSLTKKIRRALSQHARLYGRNFGWQIVAHPPGNMAILNVPLAEGTTSHQFVMNTLSGAWCRFTGQNAACWANFGDGLYFGGPAGVINQADVADADYGQPMVADLKSAFSAMRRPGVEKSFKLLQPTITTDGQLAPTVAIDTDYGSAILKEAGGVTTDDGIAIWDVSNWDEANWSDDVQTTSAWNSVIGVGKVGSVRVRIMVKSKTGAEYGTPLIFMLSGFNVVYEAGGIL